LGGHPLAGKEQRGMDAAEAGLFSGRSYVLTPAGGGVIGIDRFRELLARMGAHVIEMSAEDHDKTVALTSHAPQLISTALAFSLGQQANDQLSEVFGPGLLDMTRLALSDGDLWAGILESNRDNIQEALRLFANSLLQLQEAIGKPELAKLFQSASTFSREIRRSPFTT
jgi:prephenate dehydrogenase